MSFRRFWIWVGNIIGAIAALTAVILASFDREFRTESRGVIRTLFWDVSDTSEDVDRWLRWRLRAIFVSPFAVFILAYYLPREDALIWIPIFLFVPIIVLVLVGTERTSWTVGVVLLPLGRKTILALTSLMVVAIAAGTLFAAVPVANDRHLIPLFSLLVVLLAVPTGNNSEVKLVKVAAAVGIVTLIVIFFLGGRTKALAKAEDVGAALTSHTEGLFATSGKTYSARLPQTRPMERVSYRLPYRPLITPPLLTPNDPCRGLKYGEEDFSRLFDNPKAQAAIKQPGSKIHFNVYEKDLVPTNCFGLVTKAPTEFVKKGGYCIVPCYWEDGHCTVADPKHDWEYRIQYVIMDASGGWVPFRTYGPIYWSNNPSDAISFDVPSPGNPLWFRLSSVHNPHGGVTLVQVPPGGCKTLVPKEQKSPEGVS